MFMWAFIFLEISFSAPWTLPSFFAVKSALLSTLFAFFAFYYQIKVNLYGHHSLQIQLNLFFLHFWITCTTLRATCATCPIPLRIFGLNLFDNPTALPKLIIYTEIRWKMFLNVFILLGENTIWDVIKYICLTKSIKVSKSEFDSFLLWYVVQIEVIMYNH